MSEKSKVLDFQSGAQRSELNLPPLLAALRDGGWSVLSESMFRLMDSADDALFELADRALNANEQNLYFEAMREIRVQRRTLEQHFSREVSEGFRGLVAQSARGSQVAVSSLELLEYDDMEEQVAVESMAAKAEKRFQPYLNNLCASLQPLATEAGATAPLTEKSLPLGPLATCKAFASACHILNIDIKPKLVLFKLFDRHVVAEFEGLYRALEDTLRRAGSLVEVDVRPRVEGQRSTEGAGSVFDVLKGLNPRSGDKASADAEGESAGETVQISKAALLAVLGELQSSQLERIGIGLQNLTEMELIQLPPELADKLASISQQGLGEADVALAQRDFDIINLVALLFQYLLEDSNLAAAMKGLIAHLQIPVLKVAMQDKRFFSKDGHPARLLLNKIADACIGWSPSGDCEDDPLYVEIEELVRDILGRTEADASVFETALNSFSDYLEKEQRRADILTQRMLDAEGNRAAADAARAEVDQILQARIDAQPHAVPEPLQTLLRDGWSKVLFLHHVQQGTDSQAWQNALSLVDNLLWSVLPVESADQRDKLLGQLPLILEELRSGLNQVGFNPYDMKQLLHDLEAIHLNRLKRVTQSAANAEARGGRTKTDNKNDKGSGMDDIEQVAGDTDLEALDAELASLDEPLVESLGEETAQAAGEATPAPAAAELRAEAELLLAKLHVGSWVEFVQAQNKKQRCRLAAVIASTGRHIFVNRSGVKVAEYTRDELLVELIDERLMLLDDGMLFDRALESVISNLRDMKDKPI